MAFHVLTIDEFVDQNPHLFRRLHYHDGVWWDEVYPGLVQPALKYQELIPGARRPAFQHRILGYRHLLPAGQIGHYSTDYMVLEGDRLREFSLQHLPKGRRNIVRRGLKNCHIADIDDLEPWLEQARLVCVSHAERGSDTRSTFHSRPSFFIDQAEVWRAQMRRDFAHQGRRWLGAWYQGQLVAYLVVLRVGDIAILDKHKSHTDYLQHFTADALYYTFLEWLAGDETCRRVYNSSPQRAGLDHFKQQFLFEPLKVPMYLSRPWLFHGANTVMRLLQRSQKGQS